MNTEKAYNLGQKAFIAGKKCVPAFDSQLMEGFRGLQIGEGTQFLAAWNDGWFNKYHEATKVF